MGVKKSRGETVWKTLMGERDEADSKPLITGDSGEDQRRRVRGEERREKDRQSLEAVMEDQTEVPLGRWQTELSGPRPQLPLIANNLQILNTEQQTSIKKI